MKKYYYKDNHLYQTYCAFEDKIFNTRKEYLDYCNLNNIELKPFEIKIKNKYALEIEDVPPTTTIKVLLAKGTTVFDERDLSNFYFENEEDANKYLDKYKEGGIAFVAEALFSGYEDEPDYSVATIVNNLLSNVKVKPFETSNEFKRIANFIISYLPDNIEERNLHKQAHLNQIKSIKAVMPNVKIFIIAQNYKDEDYLDDPQIEYYNYSPLGAMKARNIALKHFYDSDYDFCILNDDDTVVAPTKSAANFIIELENNSDKFKDLDVIWSRDMGVEPYQQWETYRYSKYNKNWVFDFKPVSTLHYAIIRNFKKFYNKEEYQIESINSSLGEGADDLDFCYYLHTQGYKIKHCLNGLQSYAQNVEFLKGSIVFTDNSNPWIRLNNREITEKKYLLDPKGKISLDYFVKKYNLDNTELIIERDEVVDTFEDFNQRNTAEIIKAFEVGPCNYKNREYYYKDHHLYQMYGILDDKCFNTREEYLDYCELNNLDLIERTVRRKSKCALEWEDLPPVGWVKALIARGTYLYDNRDLSNFYIKNAEEADEVLIAYGVGNAAWAVSNQFSGYEGEPDYTPDGIVLNYLKDIKTYEFNPEEEVKKFAHFIISYLPDDDIKREKRKKAHWNQLQSIKAITPNAKVHIVAQNYREEDYIDDPQIVYHKFGKLGAMKARNTALKLLYESDYDFGIINDDDVFLAPNQSAINFFKELEDHTEKFDSFDIIWSRDMYHHPYQPNEVKHHEYYSSNWCFTSTLINVWHWAIFRNLKKFYNKEEYQDESVDPTTGHGYDDADFCYYLQTQGYRIWKNYNALHSYAQSWYMTDSVVYDECVENPLVRINNTNNSAKKWLDVNKEGFANVEAFKAKYGLYHIEKQVPREEYIDVLEEFNQRNAPEFISLYKKAHK